MDELSFRAYGRLTRKYQSIVQRLLNDSGPPRKATVVFADRSKMDIFYGDESFIRDMKNCLIKLVSREKRSRGLEN